MKHLNCFELFAAVLSLSSLLFAQDSLNISQVGHLYDFWDWPSDIELQEHFAYVAMESAGLRVVDIGNADVPLEIARLYLGAGIQSVELRDGRAYIISDDGHFFIADVSDPASPQIIGTSPCTVGVGPIAIAGNYVCVLTSTGFDVLDVSNPSLPDCIGYFTTPDNVYENDIDASGSYVFFAADANEWLGPKGLYIADISNPVEPVAVSHIGTPYNAFVLNDTLIIGGFDNAIVDVSNPANPEWLSNFSVPYEIHDCSAADTLFFTTSEDSLYILSCADPRNPYRISTLGIPGGTELPLVLDVADHTACVAGRNGLHVGDWSNPQTPVLHGALQNNGEVRDVAVSFPYAYVVHDDSSLRVVDVSNPSTPIEVAVWRAPFNLWHVGFSSEYLMVWSDRDSLSLLDFTNSLSPVPVGSCALTGWITDIVPQENLLYALGSNDGLRIVDISVPSTPVIIAEYDQPGNEWGIDVQGNCAYLSDGGGLRILNVTNPAAPVSVGYYDDVNSTFDVTVYGNYAYLSTVWGFPFPGSISVLHVLDISNPAAPELVFQTNLPVPADESVIYDHYLIRAISAIGLLIYDIANPTLLSQTGFYRTPGNALNLDVQDGFAYVADQYFFGIYDVSAATSTDGTFIPHPSSLILYSNFPNPFNSSTDIRIELPQTEHVKLEVFDVMGRSVSLLADEVYAAGSHHVTFDGTGLSSGVYIYRLTGSTQTMAKKMMLLK